MCLFYGLKNACPWPDQSGMLVAFLKSSSLMIIAIWCYPIHARRVYSLLTTFFISVKDTYKASSVHSTCGHLSLRKGSYHIGNDPPDDVQISAEIFATALTTSSTTAIEALFVRKLVEKVLVQWLQEQKLLLGKLRVALATLKSFWESNKMNILPSIFRNGPFSKRSCLNYMY